MKFVVTCLDGGGFRVLASKSKVFTSLPEAIKYGGTVSLERKAEVVPVIDAKIAAEAVFLHMVEHRQDLVVHGDPEEVRAGIRYEWTDSEMVAFAEGYAAGFLSADFLIFSNELDRLVLEACHEETNGKYHTGNINCNISYSMHDRTVPL